MIAMDAEQDLYGRYFEPEKLDKLSVQILNFFDTKACMRRIFG